MLKIQDKQGDSAKQATQFDRNRALALGKIVTGNRHYSILPSPACRC